MPKTEIALNNGQVLSLYDLDDAMNAAFKLLYDTFNEKGVFDIEALKAASPTFFDAHQKLPEDAVWHDNYFHNFAILWRSFVTTGQFVYAEHIWELALKPVESWEQSNQPNRLHKGAVYYYLSVTNILRRDLDRGFLFVHQAADEDRKTHNITASGPALAFAKLDDSVADQVFQPRLKEVNTYLSELINNYRLDSGRTLTVEQFRSKFLDVPQLQDIVFVFAYVLFRFYALLQETSFHATRSLFTGQLSVNLLFDLCLVVENVINHPSRVGLFMVCARELAGRAGLSGLQGGNELGVANGRFRNDPETNLVAILENTFVLSDGTTKPSKLERDLLLAYGFRNHGGHNVHSYGFVYERLSEIFQSIMNILFLSCEEFL